MENCGLFLIDLCISRDRALLTGGMSSSAGNIPFEGTASPWGGKAAGGFDMVFDVLGVSKDDWIAEFIDLFRGTGIGLLKETFTLSHGGEQLSLSLSQLLLVLADSTVVFIGLRACCG